MRSFKGKNHCIYYQFLIASMAQEDVFSFTLFF